MRARGRSLFLGALLAACSTAAVAGLQGPHIAGANGGPHAATLGPAIVGGAVVVPPILPAAGNADMFCPSTIPTKVNNTVMVSNLAAVITCVSPAVPVTVQSVSFWVDGTGTTGAHMKCSVWTFPPGYVPGNTITKVASGCDTTEWTAPANNLSQWITLPTTGACSLPASARYMIGCSQDASYYTGVSASGLTAGVQPTQVKSSITYSSPLPASWVQNNSSPYPVMAYLSISPS